MTIKEINEQLMKDYPVQDDSWPSRRWKADGSDYVDLSGEEEKTVVETVDMTPSWGALLPVMLDLYKQSIKKKTNARSHNPNVERDIVALDAEFAKMSKAADKWIAHCKSVKSLSGE